MTVFEVDDTGLLSRAGLPPRTSRADYYEDADHWRDSRKQFASAVEECQPLAWAVHELYTRYRDGLSARMGRALTEELADEAAIETWQSQLDEMPEEPEEGVFAWLATIDDEYHEHTVIPEIAAWFNSEPDWAFEDDYISDGATAYGAAFEYFNEMPIEVRKKLGIKVIAGDRPGSTYYAAELHCGIDEANSHAEKAELSIRFVHQHAG